MQLRNLLLASAIGLSLASIAGFASAQQIYKWKDANGVTHFSQTPPASGMHYTKMHLDNAPDVSSNPPPPGNSQAAKNAPPQATTGGSQPDTPSNRASLCKQLTSNIALLKGQQPVVTGSGANQAVMSDNARERQLATARAQQAQYCASKGA